MYNTESDDIVVAGNCGDRAYARGEDGGGSACGEGEDAGGEEEERTTRRYATTNTTPTTEKAAINEVEIDAEEDYKNGEVGQGDCNPLRLQVWRSRRRERLNQHPLRRIGIV